ncbi:MAG TPA: extracellular solute-binding protein [Polyangia bacterium]|nr:extracellular solute-binding protein [Polyangia bacterium]
MRTLRALLLLLPLLGCAGLVGCGSPAASSPDAGASQEAGGPALELFTWWVAPGEVEALTALVDVYERDHPGARVDQFNDATSANWESMLAKGIDGPTWDVTQISAAGIPVFLQDHMGTLLPVDDIYADPSLAAAVIPDILAAATYDGHAMGVVTGVHRNNAFIYNLQVLQKYQLSPPTTIAELLDVCATLKAAGVTPIATTLDAWILRFLYLDLLSGVVGADTFGKFVRHELPVSAPQMQDGIAMATSAFVEVFTKYVDLPAMQAPNFDWTTAADSLRAGKTAMYFLGDWLKGYLVHLGWTPGVDFGVSGPPGASDVFVYGADTFALPAHAPHPQLAHDFLQTVASPDAQVAFNRQKGSTPMRVDVRDRLDGPGQQNLDDLVNATVRLPGFDNAMMDTAMTAYVSTGDAAALLQSLQTIEP